MPIPQLGWSECYPRCSWCRWWTPCCLRTHGIWWPTAGRRATCPRRRFTGERRQCAARLRNSDQVDETGYKGHRLKTSGQLEENSKKQANSVTNEWTGSRSSTRAFFWRKFELNRSTNGWDMRAWVTLNKTEGFRQSATLAKRRYRKWRRLQQQIWCLGPPQNARLFRGGTIKRAREELFKGENQSSIALKMTNLRGPGSLRS